MCDKPELKNSEWGSSLKGDPFSWLLDSDVPGLRYLVLRELSDLPEDDTELIKEKKAAHTKGPIGIILDAMKPEGYWVEPGPGYDPKYRSTVWMIINIAQLGASIDMDPRIEQACAYLMEHGFAAKGQFTSTGEPSGTYNCLQGAMLCSLIDMGYRDPRLEPAYDWMARTVTGEGLASATDMDAPLRFFKDGLYGPMFRCARHHKDGGCEWGAGKVMLALGKMPAGMQSSVTKNAIERGSEFLFGADPVMAKTSKEGSVRPSIEFLWRFGYPVFYLTDIVEILEALALLGFAKDPRFQSALTKVLSMQDDRGRWSLGISTGDTTWIDYGKKGEANPWVTLRVLKVLKMANG